MDVLSVSAIRLKTEKRARSGLLASCSSCFWDFSRSLIRLHASHRLDPWSGEGEELESRLFDSSAVGATVKGATSQDVKEVASCAGEFIKVSGRALGHRQWDFLPFLTSVFSANQWVKSFLPSTEPHTEGAVRKCLSLQGTTLSLFFFFFSFFFWKTSVTKLESQLK